MMMTGAAVAAGRCVCFEKRHLSHTSTYSGAFLQDTDEQLSLQ